MERSIETLTGQYEACEGVRMDASDLETSPCTNEHGLLRFILSWFAFRNCIFQIPPITLEPKER